MFGSIAVICLAFVLVMFHIMRECREADNRLSFEPEESNEADAEDNGEAEEKKSNKTKFITFHEDYHGKTHGALSFTRSESFASGFHVGIPEENVITIKPGDINELKEAIDNAHESMSDEEIKDLQTINEILAVNEESKIKRLEKKIKKENEVIKDIENSLETMEKKSLSEINELIAAMTEHKKLS